ncbi:MAG: cupredoxin domain-containing protein [Methanoregulaceae archaeon]|nr:cupredoxin domain-containing protein [Methanoregulaceae archaeon]
MNRPYPLFLICIIGAAILCVGCTTQPGSEVTPVPTTVPTTIMTTAIPATTSTPGSTLTGETVTATTAPGVPTASPTEDRGERVKIKANNFAFDVSTITVPAGSRVIVEFENEEGVPHNVAFYTSPSLSSTIYKGEIITGPREITYTFTAPATPGIYYFRCDVHPDMDGQFIVT